jgi:WD40 repeat protein
MEVATMSAWRLMLPGTLVLATWLPRIGHAAAPPSPRVDAAGFLLPERARLRLGRITWGMPGHIVSMDASPDGRLLAIGTMKGHIQVLNLTTGSRTHGWDLRCNVNGVYFAHGGRTLVVDLETAVRLFDVARGTEPPPPIALDHGHPPPAVARAASKIALLGEPGTTRCVVRLVDAATGRVAVRKDLFPRKATRAALSPDGRLLATGHDDASIRLWDTGSWKILRRLDGLEEEPHWLAFSPDGSFVAAAKHGRARAQLWDVKTGKALLLDKERPEALHFALPPDGRSVALIFEDHVKRFDVQSRRTTPWMSGCDLYLNGFAFTPDGKSVTVAEQKMLVRLWDAAKGRPRGALDVTASRVTEVRFVADGRRLFARAAGGGGVWNVNDGRDVSRPALRAVSPDGATGIVASGKDLARVDLVSGRVIARYKLTDGVLRTSERYTQMTFSPDGRSVAVMSLDPPGSFQLRLYVADSGELRWDTRPLSTPRDVYPPLHQMVQFSPTGELIVASTLLPFRAGAGGGGRLLHHLWLWDAGQGRALEAIPARAIDCSAFAFTVDDYLLLTNSSSNPGGAGPGLQLQDLSTGRSRLVTTADPRQTTALAISPNGRFVAVGEDSGRILLWDLRAAKEAGRLEGHARAVRALAFSADSRDLASGSDDTTIVVWNVSHLSALPAPADATKADPARLWQDVAGADSWTAWQAMWRLRERPREATAILRKHVRPASVAEGEVIARLIADLDSERFATREAATRELEKLGPKARPALETVLAEKPSLEQKMRIRRMLAWLVGFRLPAHERRALLLLEWAGDAEARRFLGELARGAAESPLTGEAKAVLGRLERAGKRP